MNRITHLSLRREVVIAAALLVASFIWANVTCSAADMSVVFTRKETGSIELRLRFKTPNELQTRLQVESEWGGIKNSGSEFTGLSVTESNENPCRVVRADDTSWTVDHAPQSELVVRYTIEPQLHRNPVQGNDYRTTVRPDFFHTILHLSLLHPVLSQADKLRFRVEFVGFTAQRQKVFSSFGEGEGPFEFESSLDRLLHSTIMAGTIDSAVRTVENNKIAVAVEPANWSFSVEQLADAVEKVVQIHRGFFKDHSDPWFLVTLSSRPMSGPAGISMGGTALGNAFSMYCTTNLSLNPSNPESKRAYWLLAHEYFHNWNGIKIPTAGEDPQTYWFSEGFTNFFARRLMHRSGLIDDGGFAEDLNRTLAMFDNSPQRSAPNSFIAKGFWTDRYAQELPYQRGDLAALWLDEQIRLKSNETKSIDDFLLDLFHNPPKDDLVTCDTLLSQIEPWISPEAAQLLRAAVVEGKDLPLPEEILLPRLKLSSGVVRGFDPNFDTDAARTSGRISGVREDSAAYAAGLRNGQKLRRFDIQQGGPTTAPSAKVVILEDGKEKSIQYDAVGKPTPVRVYQPLKKESNQKQLAP